MEAVSEGTILWEPAEEWRRNSRLQAYITWLERHKGLTFEGYQQLWAWSVAELEAFWASLWEFFEIRASKPYTQVLSQHAMPGAHWFSGAELNFAEHVSRNASSDRPAIIFQSELQPLMEVSWDELQQQVAAVTAALRQMGVRRGDRVVAHLPNIPEAVIAFLACASLGAIWSSCSPEMGSGSVVDRFKQIAPKLLFAVDGYMYNGKAFDRRPVVAELQQALPTLERTVLIPYLDRSVGKADLTNAVVWETLLSSGGS